jgi:cytochrome c oxidase accessory protein FixG
MSSVRPPNQELSEDRPGSIDEHGSRIDLHPSTVHGFFRRWRTAVYGVLMLIFLLLPWTTVNGVQTVLLDIPQRRFALFGITFWAHDAPMLFFVFGGGALALLFVTAVWGRVWCGWACPQTVFIDLVYRRIEEWIEGPPQKRRKLDAAPYTLRKVGLRSAKWSAYALVSVVIANCFLAYFVGAERLLEMIGTSPFENATPFIIMLIASGLTLFNFGWFREQFCLVACPYGRMQTVLMDGRSLAPLYDPSRGEPRRKGKVNEPGQGDCVNCYRCVQVCPTGIDIRRGLQMECIACTACIDACDEVMAKTSRPLGLISYTSQDALEKLPKERKIRPYLYAAILAVFLVVFSYALFTRTAFDLTVTRATGALFSPAGDGMVVNRFRLHAANQTFDKGTVHIALDDASAAGAKLVTAVNPVELGGGAAKIIEFFVRFSAEKTPTGKGSAVLRVQTTDGPSARKQETTLRLDLLGPVAAAP